MRNLYGTSVAKFRQRGHLGDAGAGGVILENYERIWEAIIRHMNINIITSLKLGLNLFFEVMKAQ
jgi:hypothetical protein